MIIKPIPGFPGYAATSEGMILSYWRRQFFGRKGSVAVIGETPIPKRDFDRKLVSGKPSGYRSVKVKHADGRAKNRYVHELVLFAFKGPRPSDAHEALHGNDVRDDNRPDNLRWGTTQENADDRKRAGHVHRGDAWYRVRNLPPPWVAEAHRDAVIAETSSDAGPFDDLLGIGAP